MRMVRHRYQTYVSISRFLSLSRCSRVALAMLSPYSRVALALLSPCCRDALALLSRCSHVALSLLCCCSVVSLLFLCCRSFILLNLTDLVLLFHARHQMLYRSRNNDSDKRSTTLALELDPTSTTIATHTLADTCK